MLFWACDLFLYFTILIIVGGLNILLVKLIPIVSLFHMCWYIHYDYVLLFWCIIYIYVFLFVLCVYVAYLLWDLLSFPLRDVLRSLHLLRHPFFAAAIRQLLFRPYGILSTVRPFWRLLRPQPCSLARPGTGSAITASSISSGFCQIHASLS